ncbi:MAG: hypothetical protein IKY19_02855 [Bacteroidaceae bacterium]|nr:hypothetical protein [Bacteroidaceae bacterium]MBR4967162.1 hypothetical protein [Bacteroidaceae bacterium]
MPGNRFWKNICLLALPALLFACREEVSYVERISIASVGDVHLYKDEADIIYAQQGRGMDSAAFMQNYVERWAIDVLFHQKAKENIVQTDEIEKMVENYRTSLIQNIYQDRLITQQLLPSISDAEVQAFYKKEQMLFELTEPYVKGFYVQLPAKASKTRDVRNWCLRKGQDDLEKLEKLCSENDYGYQFFMEEWIPFSDLAHKLPLTEQQLMDRLLKKSTIEFKEGKFTYFVCADSILQRNDTKPIEMVSDEIKELLLNSKKANFIKTVKRSLYEDALKTGRVILY